MRAIITLDAPVHNVVHLLLWRAKELWPHSYIESGGEAIGLGVLKFADRGVIHLNEEIGFLPDILTPIHSEDCVVFLYNSGELHLCGTREIVEILVNYPNWSGRVTCS